MATRNLSEQSGYIDITIKQQDIVMETDIIINLKEVRNIVDQMTENINLPEVGKYYN